MVLRLMSETRVIPEKPPAGVALFDLDGTLVAWDCQLLFRHFVVRRQPWRGLLLPVFLIIAPLAKLLGTETMKRVFLSYLWRIDEGVLRELAREFADALVPSVYPEVRAMLDEHIGARHFTVLTSASPEFYVREIGERLGFDLSLGTVVESGPLFPDLENHKGAAKVDRLRELLPAGWFDEAGRVRGSHGYSDSTADLPLLAVCEKVMTVNPGERLTELAKERGWQVVRPQRPWKGRPGFAWRALKLLLGVGSDPGGLRRR